MTATTQPTDQAAVDAFAERVFESVLGTMDTWSIFLGDKLGFYDALAGSDGLTRDELAMQTKSHWRYANEWLEHQVTTGFLEVDDPALPAEKRKYSLPASHAAT